MESGGHGVMCLQAGERQKVPATARGRQGGKERLLRGSRRSQPWCQLDFGPPVSRRKERTPALLSCPACGDRLRQSQEMDARGLAVTVVIAGTWLCPPTGPKPDLGPGQSSSSDWSLPPALDARLPGPSWPLPPVLWRMQQNPLVSPNNYFIC